LSRNWNIQNTDFNKHTNLRCDNWWKDGVGVFRPWFYDDGQPNSRRRRN